jgi:protein-disulfide isomerase
MDDLKIKLGLIVATIVILIIGVFVVSGKFGSTGSKIDSQILVSATSHQTATGSAQVTLVEFSDFQCPACIDYYPVVKKITEEYKDKMNFVYRNFPLQQHKNALPAATAAEAAAKQGQFFQMYDKLFTGHLEWENEADPKTVFEKYAKDLSLSLDKFRTDMNSDEVKKIIEDDYQDGLKAGVDSTPSFYVNGEKIQNAVSFEDFKKIIDNALKNNPVAKTTVEPVFHAHINLKVLVNGKPVDFSQDKYQSKEGKELDQNIHFHDGVGDIVHIHKQAVKIGELFNSLAMSFDKSCISIDEKNKYCSDSTKKLRMYVNGTENTDLGDYEPKDLDRILITYGNETDTKIKDEIAAVADNACIYSEKCPERGTPPSEECVGGLGTNCK